MLRILDMSRFQCPPHKSNNDFLECSRFVKAVVSRELTNDILFPLIQGYSPWLYIIAMLVEISDIKWRLLETEVSEWWLKLLWLILITCSIRKPVIILFIVYTTSKQWRQLNSFLDFRYMHCVLNIPKRFKTTCKSNLQIRPALSA